MTASMSAELLERWELGLAQRPAESLLDLLTVMSPCPGERIGDLSMGERDARLLGLRRLLFGERLDAVAYCPRCDTPIEFDVPVQELLALHEPASTPPRMLDGPSGELEMRPVTAADVLAALSAEAPEREVVRRCVTPLLADDELTDELVTIISERLATLDPLADLIMDLVCPECTAPCQLGLDVGAFLWDELSSWAWRTFGDINDLARAYGWTEAEILRLSPARRARYVELARG